MKLRNTVIVTLLALACGACPPLPAAPLTQPEVLPADGEFAHSGSGIKFPVAVAGLKRDRILRYDTEGTDLSAGYKTTALAVTVYVYPMPTAVANAADPSQSAFDAQKNQLLKTHTDAQLVKEQDASISQSGKTSPGKVATFEYDGVFGGTKQKVVSHIYLFCPVGDKWIVKYWFTHPKNVVATKRIAAFLQNFKLTK